MTLDAKKETWLFLDSRDIGGIETHVMQLARALQCRWGEIRIVLYEDYGGHPLLSQLKGAGIAWEYLQGSFASVLRALSRRPRLLHTHGYKAGLLGRAAGLMRCVPVVSTYHAGEPGSGRIRLYNMLDCLTAATGTAIAVSPQIRRRILGPAHLVSNFVEIPPLHASGEATAIGYVGRLVPEKGADLFCRLAAKHPQENFRIYGDGPLRADLERQYGRQVRFMGQVDSMGPHWSDLGLLCMPSRYEGLPYAALEAMAHGVPVVAFDVGDLAKIISQGKTGWLAPAGDLAALNGFLSEWLGQQKTGRQQFSEAAREWIKTHFSPDSVVPEIIEIYETALMERQVACPIFFANR